MKRYTFWAMALTLLFVLPATAAVRTVPAGIDIWHTRADGSTFIDFAKIPVPAGFFCNRSVAFTERVILKGKPLATGLPGSLGTTDTVVERLDNATFDNKGIAYTRVQIRAIQFENVAPIKTACGDFSLKVNLSGQQPITRMRIIRDNDKGGRFSAPIGVNIKLTFTPTSGASGQRLEMFHRMKLAANPNTPWSANLDKRYRGTRGPVVVDTDGDLVPDTILPATTPHFVAGLDAAFNKISACHPEAAGIHCTELADEAMLVQ